LEQTTFVLPQDQLADAMKSSINRINAKLAQVDNWLMPLTQDVLQNQIPALETKLFQTN
jgi:hypothetical protein